MPGSRTTSLLRVAWFRRRYTRFTGLRDRLYSCVRSLRVWQATRRWLSAVRTRVRAFWRGRLGVVGR